MKPKARMPSFVWTPTYSTPRNSSQRCLKNGAKVLKSSSLSASASKNNVGFGRSAPTAITGSCPKFPDCRWWRRRPISASMTEKWSRPSNTRPSANACSAVSWTGWVFAGSMSNSEPMPVTTAKPATRMASCCVWRLTASPPFHSGRCG